MGKLRLERGRSLRRKLLPVLTAESLGGARGLLVRCPGTGELLRLLVAVAEMDEGARAAIESVRFGELRTGLGILTLRCELLPFVEERLGSGFVAGEGIAGPQ